MSVPSSLQASKLTSKLADWKHPRTIVFELCQNRTVFGTFPKPTVRGIASSIARFMNGSSRNSTSTSLQVSGKTSILPPSRYHGLNKILSGHAKTLCLSFREETIDNSLQCRLCDHTSYQGLFQLRETF